MITRLVSNYHISLVTNLVKPIALPGDHQDDDAQQDAGDCGRQNDQEGQGLYKGGKRYKLKINICLWNLAQLMLDTQPNVL